MKLKKRAFGFYVCCSDVCQRFYFSAFFCFFFLFLFENLNSCAWQEGMKDERWCWHFADFMLHSFCRLPRQYFEMSVCPAVKCNKMRNSNLKCKIFVQFTAAKRGEGGILIKFQTVKKGKLGCISMSMLLLSVFPALFLMLLVLFLFFW